MINTLIIDDEEDGRAALKMAIDKYCPELSVIQLCDTPEQGLEAIKINKPDLVFLDVQMPNMSGFDLLQRASPVDFEVIFVTAHDQYAIKAIKFSALDYLLKPVDITELLNSIQKVKERLQVNNAHRYQSVLHNVQYKKKNIEKLAIPTAEGIDFFETDDLIFCKADGSYTALFLKNKTSKIVCKNLKDFEGLLMESGFCRVHHAALINMRHIQKYVKGEGGHVIMTDGHVVTISRRKKEEFLLLLNRV